ncbi:MAG: hypothetical protein E7H60_23190 [Pseudomonas oryzihabitans]|nr:hypothetical protein [Pseudomonas oryzihabitans]MDU4059454.1 hypothetical protein [Pseudomonas oryzihabitans]
MAWEAHVDYVKMTSPFGAGKKDEGKTSPKEFRAGLRAAAATRPGAKAA